MDKELPLNIVLVPKGHYKAGTFPQPARWFVGKIVKVSFRSFAPEEMEHMWVKVESNTRWHLTGVLDNHPRFATYLSCGDRVTFRPYDVVAIDS